MKIPSKLICSESLVTEPNQKKKHQAENKQSMLLFKLNSLPLWIILNAHFDQLNECVLFVSNCIEGDFICKFFGVLQKK